MTSDVLDQTRNIQLKDIRRPSRDIVRMVNGQLRVRLQNFKGTFKQVQALLDFVIQHQKQGQNIKVCFTVDNFEGICNFCSDQYLHITGWVKFRINSSLNLQSGPHIEELHTQKSFAHLILTDGFCNQSKMTSFGVDRLI